MAKFSLGVFGSIGWDTEARHDPRVQLAKDGMHDLLRALAAAPMGSAGLRQAYPSLVASVDALLALGFFREENGRTWLNFTVFTGDDERIINDICRRDARELAAAIERRRADIWGPLSRHRVGVVTIPQLAYVTVGALTLDVACLTWLPDWGYMLRCKDQPGGNNYMLFANEQTDTLDLKGVFWGCHSDETAPYTLFTFGDHAPTTRRRALPDEVWRARNRAAQDVPPALAKSANGWADSVIRDAAETLALIRSQGPNATDLAVHEQAFEILRAYGYVMPDGEGAFQLAVPVLSPDDAAMVDEARGLVKGIVHDHLSANYPRLRQELLAAGLTPLRHGVSFDEVFVQLWHYIFGFTNQQLAASGFMFDPYADGRWPGYMPAACHASLMI